MAKHEEILTPYGISEIKALTHDTSQFTFSLPDNIDFEFLPGDHMKIYPDPEDHIEWRPYTPTSKPGAKSHFQLIIKKYTDGMVSKFVHQKKTGESVWMSGPHEGGHYLKGMARKIGMLAGGTGITPMISIIRAVLSDDESIAISLVFSNKTIDDIILRDEFDNYAAKFPNFTRYYVLEKPPDDWQMGVGRISDEILKSQIPPKGDDTSVFVCGPPMMQIELRKKLISMGHQSDKIIFP
jgi:cytochrome-b5 reductase